MDWTAKNAKDTEAKRKEAAWSVLLFASPLVSFRVFRGPHALPAARRSNEPPMNADFPRMGRMGILPLSHLCFICGSKFKAG
jgi:hypothetical protein